MNPMNMLKNIDLSGLNKLLESVHAHLERILEENEKQTKILESMAENIKHKLSEIRLEKECRIAILGKGNVSHGAQDALARIGILPSVLHREETRNIKSYLPHIDILVNAVN